MVIITLVYVLATILICIFNGKAAKATQDQIKESRKQYEETKRLQMMPVLQFCDTQRSEHRASYCSVVVTPADETSSGWKYVCDVSLLIQNIGLGNMKEATFSWTDSDGEKIDYGQFPIESLCAGAEAELRLSFESNERENTNFDKEFSCMMNLSYKDLLENEYTQTIKFCFAIQDPTNCYNCSPLLFKGYYPSKALPVKRDERCVIVEGFHV